MTVLNVTDRGTHVAVGIVVVATYYVTPNDSEPYFEIQVATDAGDDTPRLKLLTRTLALYTDAQQAEASRERFDAEYRPAKRSNGRTCQQLVALWRSV